MVQNIVMNILNYIPTALSVQDIITVFKIAEHAGFLEKIVRFFSAQAEMALVGLKAEDIKPH